MISRDGQYGIGEDRGGHTQVWVGLLSVDGRPKQRADSACALDGIQGQMHLPHHILVFFVG